MCMALCSSLILHVRKRDKALLRSVMVGSDWNGFLLGRVRFIGWFGLVVSLWLVLVLSFACWMGPLGVSLNFV